MARPVSTWLAGAALAVTWGVAMTGAAEELEERARELFLEGREELQRGDVESGCKKLLESHLLAPTALGPLLNVADCDERAGRLATAWQRFNHATSLGEPGDHRVEFAEKRAAALEPRVPRVMLELPPGAPEGTRVTRDGEPFDDALGQPMMLDPGTHRFVVRAPGHRDHAFDLVLTPGSSQRRVAELGPLVGASPPPAPPPPPPPILPDADPAPPGMSGQAVAGWVVGGVGVAALLAGVVTGILVAVHAGTYDDHCDDRGVCDQEGLDAADAGRPLAIVSPVSFAVSGVAMGVAIPLLLTSPDGAASSPRSPALPSAYAIHLGGAF